jgi:hypothetical protein
MAKGGLRSEHRAGRNWRDARPATHCAHPVPERSYRTGYTVLLIASLLALAALTVARVVFPVPSRLEREGRSTAPAQGFTRAYWFYMLAAAFFGVGLMSLEFVSYHLSSRGTVTEHWIPLFLAISTGMGVVASLILGRLYDRIGLPVVLVGVFLCSLFSPLVSLAGSLPHLPGWSYGVWATRRRTRCSRPLSPVCCRRPGEISPSGSSTPATASAGWLEVRPPVSCTSRQYAQ